VATVRNVQRPRHWLLILMVSIIAGTGISVLLAVPLVAPRSTPRGRPCVHHSCRPTHRVRLTATERMDTKNAASDFTEELDPQAQESNAGSSQGQQKNGKYVEPSRAAEGFDVNMLTAFAKDTIQKDSITDEEKPQSDQVAEEDQFQSDQAVKEDSWFSSKGFFGGQDRIQKDSITDDEEKPQSDQVAEEDQFQSGQAAKEDPRFSNKGFVGGQKRKKARGGNVLEANLLSARTGLEVLDLMRRVPDAIVAPHHIAAACRRLALRIKTIDEHTGRGRDFNNFVRKAESCLRNSPPDATAAASLLWSISPGPMQKMLPSLQDLLVPIAAAMPDAAQGMVLRNLTNSITALAKLQLLPGAEQMVPPIVKCLTKKVKTEKLSPEQVSATMWALGELGNKASDIPEFMEAVLGQVTPESLNSFTNKDLTNFVWGLTLLGIDEFELSDHIASLVTERASSMENQNAQMDLPMLACALTQLQAMNKEVWEAVGSRLTRDRGTFKKIKKWGIAALSWSLPSIERLDGTARDMAEGVAQQVEKRKISPRQVEGCVLGPSRWK